MIVLNSIIPVFGLILLGAVLKKLKLTNEAFLSTSDRLVYFVFFPLLLFWKIGGASTLSIDWTLCAAAICTLFVVYLLSWAGIRLFSISDFQAGTFSQSCYRFNTYVGVAIVLNALGEEGVRLFGILIGFLIPIINVLAVSTLIWYSGKSYPPGQRNRLLIRALISNPLILGCIAGILYANALHSFPFFLDNTLKLTSMITLPLALISIGGSLTLAPFRQHYKQALIASMIKLLILPTAGYLFFKMFNLAAMSIKVGMIYFALPTSTAMYILSSQLNSDTRLASATIVISTLLSIISLTVVLTLI